MNSQCQVVIIIQPALQQDPFQVRSVVAAGGSSSASEWQVHGQLLVQVSKGTRIQSSTNFCSGAVSTTPTRPPGRHLQASTTTRQCYGRMGTPYGTSVTGPAIFPTVGSPLHRQLPALLCP